MDAPRASLGPGGEGRRAQEILEVVSEENIEIVRRNLELVAAAIRTREFDETEVRQILDPEVRLDASRRVFNPEVYEGVEGLRRMLEGIWEMWEEFELRPTEFVESGDSVVVLLEERGRGRDGISLSREIAYLYTLRAGRVVEWIGSMELDEALAALQARSV